MAAGASTIMSIPEEKKKRRKEKGVAGKAPLGEFRPLKKGIPGSPPKDF